MPWWTADQLVGEAVDPFRHHRFTTGVQAADTVDGYFMVLSAGTVRAARFAADRYRGFHGYDAEICSQVRTAGGDVMVTNLGLYHWAGTRFGGDSHGWHDALYTWRLRWLDAPRSRRVTWAAKRRAHRALAPLDRARRAG